MGLVGNRNVAAMLLHDVRAHRETQPGGISISAKARLEDMVDLVRAYAATGVGEFDGEVSFTLSGPVWTAQSDGDAAAWRGVADSVRNQVVDYLLQRAFVAHDHNVSLIRNPVQRNRRLVSERQQELERAADHRRQGDGSEL